MSPPPVNQSNQSLPRPFISLIASVRLFYGSMHDTIQIASSARTPPQRHHPSPSVHSSPSGARARQLQQQSQCSDLLALSSSADHCSLHFHHLALLRSNAQNHGFQALLHAAQQVPHRGNRLRLPIPVQPKKARQPSIQPSGLHPFIKSLLSSRFATKIRSL